MRLNRGMPVWHASVSVQRPHLGALRGLELGPHTRHLIEDLAVDALVGVGAPDLGEFWWLNRAVGVGHLRVPTTPEEQAVCGPGLAFSDAGTTGQFRKRTVAA